MRVNIPSDTELADLIEHRDPASVTIYLPSSPLPVERERLQFALRQRAIEADAQLEAAGVAAEARRAIADAHEQIQGDREFWDSQARSLGLFLAPGVVHAFTVANDLPELLAVGDRFDVGPLLRAVSFPQRAHVLTITEQDAHLYEIGAEERIREVALPELPADASEVLRQEPHGGGKDRIREQGTTGPRIERERYCTIVQQAVLSALADAEDPLILCVANDLEPAYRAVNSYRGLLDTGIAQHPNSQTPADLERQAREILDALYARQLAEWREQFHDLRGSGKAVSQLTEVARAATAGSVSELLFDLEATTLEGHIDAAGAIAPASGTSPTTYGLLDEIASRVLRSGGTVKAVRKEDLPEDTPVAAILRYPPVL